MNDPDSLSLHGWGQPPGYGGGGMYPGLGDPFAGPPALVNPKVVIGPGTGAAKPGLLSNLGDWKLMIDRMGGIDGIVSTMGKVQKFVVTMQQMAPLLRVFLGKGVAAGTKATNTRDAGVRRGSRNRRKGGKASVRSPRRSGGRNR